MIFKRCILLILLCSFVRSNAAFSDDVTIENQNDIPKTISSEYLDKNVGNLGEPPMQMASFFLKPQCMQAWNYIKPFSKYLINLAVGIGVSYSIYRYAPNKFPWIWAGTSTYTSLILGAAVISYAKENQALKEESQPLKDQFKQLQEYYANDKKLMEHRLAWQHVADLMKEKKELEEKLSTIQGYNEELITMNATYHQCITEQHAVIEEAKELIKTHERGNKKLQWQFDQKVIELQYGQQLLARLQEGNKKMSAVLKDTQTQVESLRQGKNILSGIVNRMYQGATFWKGGAPNTVKV